MCFLLSPNPLDYDLLMNKPLWLLYSYAEHVIERFKAEGKAIKGAINEEQEEILMPTEFAQKSGMSVTGIPVGVIGEQVRKIKEARGK